MAQLTTREFSYLRYASYARRFNWTPEQVDRIPLHQDAWLLPIVQEIDLYEQEQQESPGA